MARIVAAARTSHVPMITGRPDVIVMFVNGCATDLTGHAVTPAERAALKTGDIRALDELGANPYLIRRVFRGNFEGLGRAGLETAARGRVPRLHRGGRDGTWA